MTTRAQRSADPRHPLYVRSASGETVPPRGADTVTATAEGRAFFQERLSIFGFWFGALAGGSWLLLAVRWWSTVSRGVSEQHAPLSGAGTLHLLNGLLPLGLWLFTRQGRRAAATLQLLDVGSLLALIVLWGVAGARLRWSPWRAASSRSFRSSLAFWHGPSWYRSTAARTLVIGALGAATIVGSAAWRNASYGAGLDDVVTSLCWAVTAVTLSVVASHTIFGLRREVHEARVFGQYTLETKIGEGGMGEVWRARHALLRHPTAVKLLPPHRNSVEAIERFEREVQLTARLTHPNSVAIYDYGRTRDGIFYYAMEFLDGCDLERLVASHGPLPAGRVVHLLTQVCSALAEAHDHQLVHRDVKPANVLLVPRENEQEQAKVLDFGLVKRITATAASASVTARNVITGTPLYMSPEAILAPDEVDARSDLYGIGALGWFLLAGRPPFEGNLVEVCRSHLHETPLRPSAALGLSVPRDLEDALLACMAKKRDDRPADARTLRAWFESCESSGNWTARDSARWWEDHPTQTVDAPDSAASKTIDLDIGRRA